MTDEEKIEAVTAALAGEFYIGQRVKHYIEPGYTGVIEDISGKWISPLGRQAQSCELCTVRDPAAMTAAMTSKACLTLSNAAL